jgi:hypothetical protein
MPVQGELVVAPLEPTRRVAVITSPSARHQDHRMSAPGGVLGRCAPGTGVSLIGQLSNRQFGQNLARLAGPAQLPDQSDGPQPSLCTCGCGAAVAAPRKFVNQEHYGAWLSQVRYIGRNLRFRSR